MVIINQSNGTVDVCTCVRHHPNKLASKGYHHFLGVAQAVYSAPTYALLYRSIVAS